MRESCGGGREERGRIPDRAPVGPVPANPAVLNNVLRFSGTAEDPVGDAQQARAHGSNVAASASETLAQ